MSAEFLSSVAGIIWSLLFSYVPGVSGWYEKLDGTYKRLIMLGLLAVSAGGAYGLACLGWFNVGLSCNQAGIEKLVSSFVLALMANQSAYLISPHKS